MDNIKPENHNFTYLGNASQNIADLPVRVGQDEHGDRTIHSAWRPSQEDIAKLLNGGVIELMVLGHSHPPVMISVASATGDLFKQEPLHGIITQARDSILRARKIWMDENPAEDGRDHETPFDVLLYGQDNQKMTEEDAACPILALAPAEYSYWEKRVWRRGVCDMETRGEVARAVSASLSKAGV